VRDVAWAASPDYQWDASGWDGILAQAYYRPSAQAARQPSGGGDLAADCRCHAG
jgi:hypothetical protein